MNISLKDGWQPMLDELVQAGRYGSADEVVDEGLRLVQEREAKHAALRNHIEAAVARGGARTPEQVRARLKSTAERIAAETSECVG